jgi:hypothetical protein
MNRGTNWTPTTKADAENTSFRNPLRLTFQIRFTLPLPLQQQR